MLRQIIRVFAAIAVCAIASNASATDTQSQSAKQHPIDQRHEGIISLVGDHCPAAAAVVDISSFKAMYAKARQAPPEKGLHEHADTLFTSAALTEGYGPIPTSRWASLDDAAVMVLSKGQPVGDRSLSTGVLSRSTGGTLTILGPNHLLLTLSAEARPDHDKKVVHEVKQVKRFRKGEGLLIATTTMPAYAAIGVDLRSVKLPKPTRTYSWVAKGDAMAAAADASRTEPVPVKRINRFVGAILARAHKFMPKHKALD